MGRGKAYDTLMDEEDQIAPKAHAVFILMAMSGAVCSLPAHLFPHRSNFGTRTVPGHRWRRQPRAGS